MTKKELRKIKEASSNKLEKHVAQYIIDQEDPEGFLEDLFYCGCASGMVTSLIYYNDTLKFYKKFQKEINDLLYEIMQETGYNSPVDLFGDKWEIEDPLALNTQNQNLLAWFGFEKRRGKLLIRQAMRTKGRLYPHLCPQGIGEDLGKEVLNVTKRRKSIIDEEKVRQQLITGIPNKAVYDEKIPTNVRLERNLKEQY